MKKLIVFLLVFSAFNAFSQNQAADYARLSAATARAWSVPERQYTYKIETKYSSSPSTSSSSSSSSGSSSSGSGISGNYSSYPAINVNAGQLRRQAEAAARQKALLDAFENKQQRLNSLISSRGLKRTPEYHSQLIQAAQDAGFTSYEASRFFGNSAAEYRNIQVSKNAPDYAWSGGVKGDCQGDCIENLSSPYGYSYTGNAKYGKPEGKGKLTAYGKYTVTGDFVAGGPNGKVEIAFNNGDVYKGTYWSDDYERGTMTYAANGASFTGTFINNRMYRGELKDPTVYFMGEFTDKTKFSYGMAVWKPGDTTHGYFTEDEDPRYYQFRQQRSGVNVESTYDNQGNLNARAIYMPDGTTLYSVPDKEEQRIGWLVKSNNDAYFVYQNPKTNGIARIEGLQPEDIKVLNRKIEEAVKEMDQRRTEYNTQMKAVHQAVGLTVKYVDEK